MGDGCQVAAQLLVLAWPEGCLDLFFGFAGGDLADVGCLAAGQPPSRIFERHRWVRLADRTGGAGGLRHAGMSSVTHVAPTGRRAAEPAKTSAP